MRRIAVLGAVLALLIVTGATRASTIVGMSGLASPVDITLENNSAGLTLNGLNFTYDNYGSSSDYAFADASGIYGTTYGVLALNFSTPVVGLKLDFSVLGVTGPDPYALMAFFPNAPNSDVTAIPPGKFVPYNPSNPRLGGDINGTLAYQNLALPFNEVLLYFSPISQDVAPPHFFTVNSISYDAAPEPSSLILLGVGAIGLVAYGRRRRQS
jgi:hypothetical protein